MLHTIYSVLQSAAQSESKDLSWAWPLLGIPDPAGRVGETLAPLEGAALAAYHRDQQSLEASRAAVAKKPSRPGPPGLEASDKGAGKAAAKKEKAAAARAAALAAAAKKE